MTPSSPPEPNHPAQVDGRPIGWWRPAHRFADAVDKASETAGRIVAWATLAMVLLGAWNAIARTIDRFGWFETSLGSNTYLEAQWYLFGLIFLFGAPWLLKRDGHVRVDFVYGRLSPRHRAAVDLLGTLLLLLPFCLATLWLAWPSVAASFEVWETSPDPGGLLRWPIKAALLVAFVLLTLQGMAQAVRYAFVLFRPLQSDGPATAGESAP